MDQPTSTPSSFTVTCPGCKRRLRFTPAADGLPRMKIHCTACHTLFGVRRPGAPPARAEALPAGGTVAPPPTYPGFPAAGTGASVGPAGSLVKQLESFSVVRCDEAAWRFLGLSLAALPSALPSAKLDLAALGRIPQSAGNRLAGTRKGLDEVGRWVRRQTPRRTDHPQYGSQ